MLRLKTGTFSISELWRCVTYIEDITRWREDMNFMFEWQEHPGRTPTWRLHAVLCKFVQNISTNEYQTGLLPISQSGPILSCDQLT